MANHRRSVEKEVVWRGQVSSGLSIRAYCREHQLSEPSFYVWRREISRRDLERDSEASVLAASATDRAGLVAVDVIGRVTRALTVEVALSTGIVIRLREDVSAATLEREGNKRIRTVGTITGGIVIIVVNWCNCTISSVEAKDGVCFSKPTR